MAGALGVRLGGRNVYFGRAETRPFLGDGPRPEARHLARAARISGAVGLAALGLAVVYPLTVGRLTAAVARRATRAAAVAATRAAVVAVARPTRDRFAVVGPDAVGVGHGR